jgi:hypothetical protein
MPNEQLTGDCCGQHNQKRRGALRIHNLLSRNPNLCVNIFMAVCKGQTRASLTYGSDVVDLCTGQTVENRFVPSGFAIQPADSSSAG